MMDERNDQIKLDFDDDNDVSSSITPEANTPSVLIDIDDENDYVSPNQDIFKKVADSINKTKADGYTATWHGTDRDAQEEFKMDDTYAGTSQTNKQFLETFGITGVGPSVDENGEETVEQEIEYTDRMQRKEIIDMYKYAKRSLKTRITLSTIFAILLFALENISFFVPDMSSAWEYLDISRHPYIHVIINLVLLLACAGFAYEQLYYGIRSIFKRNPGPESVAGVALIVALFQIVFEILFVSLSYSHKPVLVSFPVAVILVSSIVFSYINVSREKYGFGAVSSKDSKFILDKVYESEAEPEYDTFTTTTNGEFNGEIARVQKTDFVKNYFQNTNSPVDMRKFLTIYYLTALVLSFVFSIISLFQFEGNESTDLAATILYFTTSILLMLPVGTLFAYSIPFYFANRNLYEEDVAIIGEKAIDDFGKIDVIAVNDTTAFPPSNVKMTNFNVYGDYDMEKVLYYAANGFSVVGGPLAEVFEAATNNAIPKSQKVKFICAGRSYLCVSVDNEKIVFADKYGMTAQGIEVGAEREDKDDVSVMYIACGNELCARMYIRYHLDEDFIETVKRVNRNGIVVGIRTFDPNISNDLINKLAGFKKSDLRVIKLNSSSDVAQHSARIDGKIVSKGRSSSLLNAIPACKRITTARKVIKALKIIASTVGIVYIGLCVFGAISPLPPIIIPLFYGVVALLSLFFTVAILPKKR